jgi:hypothetical protein
MARVRDLNPGFFLDDELADLPPLNRLLFAGLWCLADREGRLRDRPRQIKHQVLPYDECDVDEMLTRLHDASFIYRYEDGGSQYIAIPTWKRYQKPHYKEVPSIIPPPSGQRWSELEVTSGQVWRDVDPTLPAGTGTGTGTDRRPSVNLRPVDNSAPVDNSRVCWKCNAEIANEDVLEDRCVLSNRGLRHKTCPVPA